MSKQPESIDRKLIACPIDPSVPIMHSVLRAKREFKKRFPSQPTSVWIPYDVYPLLWHELHGQVRLVFDDGDGSRGPIVSGVDEIDGLKVYVYVPRNDFVGKVAVGT